MVFSKERDFVHPLGVSNSESPAELISTEVDSQFTLEE
jgi:hypothetical protein